MNFLGETEHSLSGKNGAFWWSILVGKQKHNVQKPICYLIANSLTTSRGFNKFWHKWVEYKNRRVSMEGPMDLPL